MLNLPNEVLDLFKKTLENELTKYANEIHKSHNIPLDGILSLIPNIMNEPLIDKISNKYRDTSKLQYKQELNKYTIYDLKQIASINSVPTAGTKSQLVEKISVKIGLKDFTNKELNQCKSFISKSIKRKKISPKNKTTIKNIVYDSD